MRHWTEQTDREAETFYATLTVPQIRRYQDITRQQIPRAYVDRNEDALADLHAQEEALTREMLRRQAR